MSENAKNDSKFLDSVFISKASKSLQKEIEEELEEGDPDDAEEILSKNRVGKNE